MDPKGDRLRKLKMGTLKLPESVLKSNNIILTSEPAKIGGGCLEGGARPRPVSSQSLEGSAAPTNAPIIIPTTKRGGRPSFPANVDIPLPLDADIPLPSDADIPLPSDADIPLPVSKSLPADIPLPRDEDIPLPSNASIPLPADKPPNERRKIKVSLSHLEPRGDELLCRSCVMKFSKQLDYDLHLQSDAHQQAIKADLQENTIHGGSLLIPRQDRKSPSNDSKSGTVSFTFKKNIGHRITSMQPFLRRDDKSDRNIGEIKVLRLEPETGVDKMTSGLSLVNSYGTEKDDSSDSNSMVGVKDSESKDKKLMCSFVKVHCKDDSGRQLDWPKEMIQYTHTEPKIMFSCNPLSFDFSQLFANKLNKKSPAHSEGIMNASGDVKLEDMIIETKIEGVEDGGKNEEEKKVVDGEKKKSHKKKKKKKHRKHKDKTEEKDGENKTEEVSASKKKKKKKHKKKTDEAEKTDEKGTEENQEKKKHKKSKKRKHQSEEEKGKENEAGEEEKKSKKRKHKKSKKKKKKHHQSDTEQEKTDGEKEADKKNGEKKEESGSADESDNDKDKNTKKKHKKKKKHSKKEGSNNSSESESEKIDKKPAQVNDSHVQQTVENRKFHVADSDTESEKIVAKLQALNRTKAAQPVVANHSILQKKIKKEPTETDKRTPSERKRVNSESSVSETPTPSKKAKSIIKTPSGAKDKTPVTPVALLTGIKTDKNEESWSKIETQTQDNVKSKWDTSESDIEGALGDVTNKQKVLRKRKMLPGPVNKSVAARGLKSPPVKSITKVEPEHKKTVNPSSQRSHLSNVSAGSTKKISIVEKYPVKTRKASRSPASSHSSRSGSRSYRSYSRSSSRSYSRSSSRSSYYSDRSRRRSNRRRKRRRRSSTVSYSSSSSRSRSRSYKRRRSRSSSYSDYSRSRSYSSSRSRSRSRRKRRRSYSRGRSRSYSSSSYSSRSRSRSRSHRRRRRRSGHKNRRKSKSVDRTLARSSIDVTKKTTKEEKEKPIESKKVDPSDIPLPDLSGKKDDELTEEKLQKLKGKKPRTDVGETVAKLVESLPADIPLPYSDASTKTVSSDSLPSGPPSESRKETDTGFIGPRLPPPPPPPPGHNMGPPRYPPNHGPPGPPRPGYGPGQWDPWDGRGHWDSHGPWDGPGPGPRPPYRGMRPPFDPRMRGPYDPRMRGPPPHFMNRPPRGPYMGPRYPGPHGPPPEYDAQYTEDEPQEPPKKESPPPLPPPKAPSPKPPPPTKKEKEKEKDKEPEQNPDIVIPPEQAEQYKHLQKQAAKHARRQLRRQQKKELGEPEEDSSSSEEEQEEKQTIVVQAAEEEPVLVEEMQQQLMAVPQQVPLVLAQPQPASSPASYVVAVSNGQQILIQKQPSLLQAGVPIQAGQPVMAVSQAAMLASHAAATANAQPAHLVHTALGGPAGHLMAATPGVPQGMPVAVHSAASLQHLQQVQQLQQIQHMQQVQQIQQIQQAQAAQAQAAQAIQAHNQAVAAAHAAQAHGPIVVGNQILVPRIGIRPAL